MDDVGGFIHITPVALRGVGIGRIHIVSMSNLLK
jgi:hypothetical protein